MAGIDMSKFEKKLILRPIQEQDFDEIISMHRLCFPNIEPWEKEHLQSQINIFPEGQLCVEYDGEIIGACSSLIIHFDEYDDNDTWNELTACGYMTNHDPEGYNLYGIEVMVHPDYRRMKIGHRLYEARKDLARALNLKSIIIGGRIPNYARHASQLTPRQYIEEVIMHNLHDPVLTFQAINGFMVKRVNPQFLEGDKAFAHAAVLMEWNNIDYQPKSSKRQFKTSFPVRITTIQYEMKKVSSFEDFAIQCEYYTDVASSFSSDFAVFPEIFTLQLLSFLPEKSPGRAIRRLTEFTEDYIELFTSLALKYNVNIIGGSHFVEEEGKIYNIAFLFRRDGTIEKQYKLHITPNERKFGAFLAVSMFMYLKRTVARLRFKFATTSNFQSWLELLSTKEPILFLPRSVPMIAKAICVFATARRQGRLKTKCIQSFPERLAIYLTLKIWIFSMLSLASSAQQTSPLPAMVLLVNATRISKRSSSAMSTWKFLDAIA